VLLLLFLGVFCPAAFSSTAGSSAKSAADFNDWCHHLKCEWACLCTVLWCTADLRGLAALQEVGLNLAVGANGLLTSLTGLSECVTSAVLRSVLSCGF
jgi:hypothetical protein